MSTKPAILSREAGDRSYMVRFNFQTSIIAHGHDYVRTQTFIPIQSGTGKNLQNTMIPILAT